MTTLSPAYIQWLGQQQIIKRYGATTVFFVLRSLLYASQVAPISIWVFDYLLTLDEEVQLMTNKGGWGITHVLYIPTRFFPMLGSLCVIYDALVTTRSQSTCVALYRFAEFILFLGMLTAEGLLLIRTIALWSHKRIICWSLIIIYGIVGIVMFVCSVISASLRFEAICEEKSSSVTTALATTLSHVTVGMFASAAFFELVVLSLTLVHGYTLRCSGFQTQGKVVSAVIQGNMVYTLSIFLTSIANITFFVLPLQDDWNGILATFQGVLHGVVASRILFNLRDALHNERDIITFSMSHMQFAPISKSMIQVKSSRLLEGTG